MGELPKTFRHRIYAVGQEWHCTCGLARIPVAEVRKHLHASRRWRYLGVETWFGERYYLWENDLSSQRYAWQVGAYQEATL